MNRAAVTTVPSDAGTTTSKVATLHGAAGGRPIAESLIVRAAVTGTVTESGASPAVTGTSPDAVSPCGADAIIATSDPGLTGSWPFQTKRISASLTTPAATTTPDRLMNAQSSGTPDRPEVVTDCKVVEWFVVPGCVRSPGTNRTGSRRVSRWYTTARLTERKPVGTGGSSTTTAASYVVGTKRTVNFPSASVVIAEALPIRTRAPVTDSPNRFTTVPCTGDPFPAGIGGTVEPDIGAGVPPQAASAVKRTSRTRSKGASCEGERQRTKTRADKQAPGCKSSRARPASLRGLAAGPDVPQRHRHQHSHPEDDPRADQGSDLQPVRERLPCRVEQRRAGCRLPDRGHRAAERVPRGHRRLVGNAAVSGACHGPPVDGGPDAAEDGDAERSAKLGAGFRDRGGRAGPLGRGGTEDEIVRQGDDRRNPDREDDGARHDGGETVRARKRRESRGGDDEAHPHHEPRPQTARDHRRQHRTGHERDRERHRPESRPHRRQPEHELQVLGDEKVRPEDHERGKHVGRDGGAEGGCAEQPQIDQRVAEAPLPVDEGGPERQSCDDRRGREPSRSVRGDPLEPVDDREHCQDGQERAGHVGTASHGIPELRQEQRTEDEQEPHHRDADEEDRPPEEMLQQEPAERGTDHRASRVARDPDSHRDRALPRIEEHVADEGQRGRRQRRARQTEHRARGDQHGCAGGEGGERRGGGECARAEEEQAPAADAVP